MTEPDWVILRLLKASCRTQAITNPDYMRSTHYMIKKYGLKALDGYIDQLNDEKERHEQAAKT